MSARFSPADVRSYAGFGQPDRVCAYRAAPQNVDELAEVFAEVRRLQRKAVLVGAQRSYGDAMLLPEQIAVELSAFQEIGEIQNESVWVGGGATLEQLWQALLPQGAWPWIVSGTAKTTVAGAIAMNIHGKNAFHAGAFEDAVHELTLMTPDGRDLRLRHGEADFHAVVGGAGLMGAVTGARLRVKPTSSGGVKVVAACPQTWEDQFDVFERYEPTAQAMVSWVDLFGKGRGIFHAAVDGATKFDLDPQQQLRTGPILGVLPRGQAWRVLRLLLVGPGPKLLNAVKFAAAKALNRGKTTEQTLAEFNFLLDAAPGWEKAYGPSGLLQFQAFVPKEAALPLFRELERHQLESGHISVLGVMKRHRPTRMLLDYSVDGYSLALDFARKPGLDAFVRQMADLVLDHGGKFYLAKDSFLSAEQFERMHGREKLEAFREARLRFDPDRTLDSLLARRLRLA